MKFVMPIFSLDFPEISILIMICVILLAGLFSKDKYRAGVAYWLTQFALLIAAGLTLHLYGVGKAITFSGAFILDPMAVLFKLAILIVSLFAFWYARAYLREHQIPALEYYLLGLISVFGMMVLVSANDFIALYLGIELVSLPIYAMIALHRDSASASEAAIKYFVMGALASGILLYGLSMLYGATESLTLPQVAQVITTTPASQRFVLVFALVFVIGGIAFKLGAVPFHVWIPDVYEGAPPAVTIFISSAPKIAGLAMAIRLLVDTMPNLLVQWQEILIAIALLSLILGNVVAIAQTNIRRMLAYSGIAHIGYMLLGLLSANANGYAAASFYIISYAIMSLGGFGMITVLSRQGVEIQEIDDLRGLNRRNPWMAFLLLMLMFSMAGVPPMLGFFAKVGVFEALIQVHLVWLAAVALAFAVIGSYYYLRVVKVMYFDEAQDPAPLVVKGSTNVAITVNGVAVLLLGLMPSGLIDLCRNAFGV